MNQRAYELKEPLVKEDTRIGQVSNTVLTGISNAQKVLKDFSRFASVNGMSKVSVPFLKTLKDKLVTTQTKLQRTSDLRRQIEDLSEAESSRSKMKQQRLSEEYKQEFEEIAQGIRVVEKMCLEKIDCKPIDLEEALFDEQDADIREISKLLYEMNELAKEEAQKIREGGEDLEIMYRDIRGAGDNTGAAVTILEPLAAGAAVPKSSKVLFWASAGCFIFILLLLILRFGFSDVSSAD